METKTKGELAVLRRGSGVFLIIITAACQLFSGFVFYNIDPAVIWAGYVTGMALLISGIAKDVVAIAKEKLT